MLYLEDGTPLQRSIGEEENVGFVKTDGPEQEAETITHTAFFDGLPQGTEKVILRFFEDQIPDWDPATRTAPEVYYVSDDTMEITPYTVGVLAEVTIDLATGEAVPSETYLEYGVSSVADTYQDAFTSLLWAVYWSDPQVAELGQWTWDGLVALPGLFQNGETLHTLEYSKANRELDVIFATDGSQPTSDLTVTVAGQPGEPPGRGPAGRGHGGALQRRDLGLLHLGDQPHPGGGEGAADDGRCDRHPHRPQQRGAGVPAPAAADQPGDQLTKRGPGPRGRKA